MIFSKLVPRENAEFEFIAVYSPTELYSNLFGAEKCLHITTESGPCLFYQYIDHGLLSSFLPNTIKCREGWLQIPMATGPVVASWRDHTPILPWQPWLIYILANQVLTFCHVLGERFFLTILPLSPNAHFLINLHRGSMVHFQVVISSSHLSKFFFTNLSLHFTETALALENNSWIFTPLQN